MAKIIQLGGFLGKKIDDMIEHLSKPALSHVTVSSAKDALSKLGNRTTLLVKEKFERKISGRGVVRAVKGFTVITSKRDMDDIIKFAGSLEKSGLLTDGATKPVKHEIKKQDGV